MANDVDLSGVGGAQVGDAVRASTRQRAERRAPARGTRLYEALACCAVGVAASWAVAGTRAGVALTLALWLWFTYHVGSAPTMPTMRPERFDLIRRGVLALGVTTLVAATGVLGVRSATPVTVAVVAATGTAALFRTLRWRLHRPERILIVGDRLAVTDLAAKWAAQPQVDVVVACIAEPDLDDSEYPADVFGAPVIRSVTAVPEAVAAYDITAVVVTPGPGMTSYDVRTLDWSLARSRTPMAVLGPAGPFAPHRVRSGVLGNRLLMQVIPTHRGGAMGVVKAALDRVAGAALLLLAAPLLSVLCVAIRRDSPGPAIFRQTRVGINGREFTMFKLRTMRQDAEKELAPLQSTAPSSMLFKLKHDPRITRLGRVLRRTSLDELPQLVNVVRGEMSLIGPRPPLPGEFLQYDAEAEHRLVVRPGMTGLWQVSGRSDLGWDDSLALDLHYIDNWRFSDDLVIAARTVGAVLLRRGAY